MTEDEIIILNTLGSAEYTYDELFEQTTGRHKITPGEFGAGLTMLELKGIIKQLQGNIYTVNIK